MPSSVPHSSPDGQLPGPSDDRELTVALQRILLPPALPDVPGWAAAALYEPAGEGVLVGGDFYDWFVPPDGRLVFLLGDVSGKGPLAGALGMSIRKALKGICWAGVDPLAAMPLLESALASEFGTSFATVCLLVIDGGDIGVLLGGHPRPLLRQAGKWAEVEAAPNAPLGTGLTEHWDTASLQLQPGEQLMLCTDGLMDARLPDGSLFSEGALEEVLAGLDPGSSTYETVLGIGTALEQRALPLTDDVVVAVLSRTSG